ncbi:hypothetical protein [Streptomyces wuyuanensis]|uniref:hypothetical protein n=1 Tax=Streptomyces wuyuanensis TaxID=1196353 RepID=UPI0034490017
MVAVAQLGERVHPETRRTMSRPVCEVVGGTAHDADTPVLSELVRVALGEIPQYVPHRFLEPVQEDLGATLLP